MARHRRHRRGARPPRGAGGKPAPRQAQAHIRAHVDGGDFVVIINADKVAVSGNKRTDKFLYSHSGHPGGLRARSVGEVLEKNPDRLVEKAVTGMLPKNKLGRAIAKKLKVYAGPNHPHAAQQPVPFEIKQVAQ